jgi:hypothetical protein
MGQHDERPALVGGAILARDQAAALHAGDVVGQPALLPLQVLHELEHPQPPVGRLGQQHQDVVVGQRQPRRLLQIPVQPGVQPRAHLQQAPPGPLLVVGQPLRHVTRLPLAFDDVSCSLSTSTT